MEFNEVANIITNTGTSIAVIGYFMYRDLKFNQDLNRTLQVLVDTVNTLKEVVMKGDK